MAGMNPLEPSPSVLMKLGSIARHVDEAMGPGGHELDAHAIKALLADPDVVEWMAAADAMALLPVKR